MTYETQMGHQANSMDQYQRQQQFYKILIPQMFQTRHIYLRKSRRVKAVNNPISLGMEPDKEDAPVLTDNRKWMVGHERILRNTL